MTQEAEERRPASPAHAPQMLEQAVGQAELAHFWAKHNRPDLAIVFTNMAKLMLLEGNGAGTECEFWVLTIRSTNSVLLEQADQALQCATRAHELAERIFSDEPQRYAVACGTLSRLWLSAASPRKRVNGFLRVFSGFPKRATGRPRVRRISSRSTTARPSSSTFSPSNSCRRARERPGHKRRQRPAQVQESEKSGLESGQLFEQERSGRVIGRF